MFKESYYQRELEKLSLKGLTVKLFSSKQDSNFLSVNENTIDDILEMFKNIKEQIQKEAR